MPVGSRGYPSVAALEPFAGIEFLDAFYKRQGARHVVEREEIAQRPFAQESRKVIVRKYALQLRTEEDVALANGEIQGFNAETIAHQDQAPGLFMPDGRREHTTKTRERFYVPLNERPKSNFGIAPGMETMPQLFELGTKLAVVIDLSVEGYDEIPGFRPHRLLAAFEINNFEPHRPE